MKFIVDAQLPYGIKQHLESLGYDTKHTNDLPNKEKTSDKEINDISLEESRVVITKDKDFLDSHLIFDIPQKLVLITTGNIKNSELFKLLISNFPRIIQLLDSNKLIEINTTGISGN